MHSINKLELKASVYANSSEESEGMKALIKEATALLKDQSEQRIAENNAKMVTTKRFQVCLAKLKEQRSIIRTAKKQNREAAELKLEKALDKLEAEIQKQLLEDANRWEWKAEIDRDEVNIHEVVSLLLNTSPACLIKGLTKAIEDGNKALDKDVFEGVKGITITKEQ